MNFLQKDQSNLAQPSGQLSDAELSILPTQAQGAIKMHRYGLKVFPAAGVLPDGTCTCYKGASCNSPGKHPEKPGWQNFKFKDEPEMRLFWQLNPYANYGINSTGLCVLDVDVKNRGAENYNKYLSVICSKVPTLCVETPSGGFHLYYKSNIEFDNKVGIFGGIDIRSKGGLIIGDGCNHKNGGKYKISYSGTDNTDVIGIAELPKELESLILSKQTKGKVSSEVDASMNAVLKNEIREGNRNDSLFRKACQLRQKGLQIDEIAPILYYINEKHCDPPLDQSEIDNILKSVDGYEIGGSITWKDPDLNYALKEPAISDIADDSIPYFFKDFIIKKGLALGVPKNSILVTLLTVFASTLGSVFKIRPSKSADYEVTLNLWGIVVAPPSSRKTAVLSVLENVTQEIEKFFIEKRSVLKAENEQKLAALQTEKRALKNVVDDDRLSEVEKQISNLKNHQIPYWMFSTSESTPEALVQSFKDNFRGILLFRDELRGLFDSLSKNGYEVLRSLLTESWNGNKPFSLSRIGRGIIDVPSMTLSILGGSQPDVLLEMFPNELRKGAGADGMLARFQLFSSYASSQVQKADSTVNLTSEKLYLDGLLRQAHQLTKEYNTTGLPFITKLYLSDAGFNEYHAYCNYIHKIVTNDELTNQAYRSHVGKFDRLVLALSAQFHILDAIFKNEQPKDEVDVKWIKHAVAITQYMDLQIQKLYFTLGKNLAGQALLSKIKNGQINDGMSLRRIYKNCWSNLKDKEDVLAAIEQISDANWITVIQKSPDGGGKETTVIKLNPKLIEHLNIRSKDSVKKIDC